MDYTPNIDAQGMRRPMGPAFTVPNPYANYGFGCYCGSSNNGCC